MSPQRKRTASLRPFLRQLSELAATLPSEREVAEARAALDQMLEFLGAVHKSLDSMPTSENHSAIASSIHVFDELVDAAEANSVLRVALGMPLKTNARPVDRRAPEEEMDRGKKLHEGFAGLTLDQIRERLVHDSTLKLTDLRALAAHLHVRYPAKSTRETLAQALTVRIANSRGYDALSRGNKEAQ